MKKEILFTMVALMFIAAPVGAEEGSGPGGDCLKKMAADLGLSAEQAAVVGSVFEKEKASRDAVMNGIDGKMAELEKATEAELAKTLTPEQMEKFRAGKMSRGKDGVRPPRPFAGGPDGDFAGMGGPEGSMAGVLEGTKDSGHEKGRKFAGRKGPMALEAELGLSEDQKKQLEASKEK